MQPIVHCKFDELLNPRDLKDNPKNRNQHNKDQVQRLAKIYAYQGVRHPIIVSKLSGFIVAGHGRKLAAIEAGLDKMPVVYQEFESDEQEYAFIQSDNAIAAWAELDLAGINADLSDLGPDFDIDMLGIESFDLDSPIYKAEEETETEEESFDGATKIIIHLRDTEYVDVMARVQDCCIRAKLTDLSEFFKAALLALEQKLENDTN